MNRHNEPSAGFTFILIAVNPLLRRLEKPDKKQRVPSGYSNNLRQKLNKSGLVSGIGTGVADSGDDPFTDLFL